MLSDLSRGVLEVLMGFLVGVGISLMAVKNYGSSVDKKDASPPVKIHDRSGCDRSGWRVANPSALSDLCSLLLEMTGLPKEIVLNVLAPYYQIGPLLMGQWHSNVSNRIFDLSIPCRNVVRSADARTMYHRSSGLGGRILSENDFISVHTNSNLEEMRYEESLERGLFDRTKFSIRVSTSDPIMSIFLGIYPRSELFHYQPDLDRNGIKRDIDGLYFSVGYSSRSVILHQNNISHGNPSTRLFNDALLHRWFNSLKKTKGKLKIVITVHSSFVRNKLGRARVFAELWADDQMATIDPIPIPGFQFDVPHHFAVEQQAAEPMSISIDDEDDDD